MLCLQLLRVPCPVGGRWTELWAWLAWLGGGGLPSLGGHPGSSTLSEEGNRSLQRVGASAMGPHHQQWAGSGLRSGLPIVQVLSTVVTARTPPPRAQGPACPLQLAKRHLWALGCFSMEGWERDAHWARGSLPTLEAPVPWSPCGRRWTGSQTEGKDLGDVL